MKVVQANEPWLDTVPADWTANRVRNVAQLSPSYSGDLPAPDELCTVVPMDCLSQSGEIDVTSVRMLEDITEGLTLFEEGDVIFAKITPSMENGKGALVKSLPTRYAFGSTEFHVLRPNHGVDPMFLYYFTFNPEFRKFAADNMLGAAGQKRVSSRFIKDTRLFLPLLQEQELISKYLDASCAAIDLAVAGKRRQLEALDGVRESLIETAVTRGLDPNVSVRKVNRDWISETPANWDVVRLKRIMSDIDYGISQSTVKDGRYRVLKMGDIASGELQFTDLDFVNEVTAHLLVEQGDLLYNRTNSHDLVGKAAVFRGLKSDEITFASYLVRLRTNHKANPYFLNYLVNCSSFLAFARNLAIPSVQQSNLNSTRYCRILIPLPPLDEQQEIREYLDGKLADLGSVVAVMGTQIDSLIAYRNLLIHECTTGQRRISEADLARVISHE